MISGLASRALVRRNSDSARRFVARFLYDRFAMSNALDHAPREAERVNLSVAVVITPMMAGVPYVDDSFFAITKDISLGGASFILTRPLEADELLIGYSLPSSPELTHLHGAVRHQEEIGGGFRQIGVELLGVFDIQPYPALSKLKL